MRSELFFNTDTFNRFFLFIGKSNYLLITNHQILLSKSSLILTLFSPRKAGLLFIY